MSVGIHTKPNLTSQKFEQTSGDSLSFSGTNIYYKPIEYNTDLSGEYTNRSLVDSGYLNSTISGLTGLTASNGLTKVGKIIKFGGILTGDTSLLVNLPAGILDDSFITDTGFDEAVSSIALQSDNKILIGGYFTSYSGVTANHIIRLNSDGSVDDTFNSGTGFDEVVSSIVVQPSDNKILVGGEFTSYSGVSANYIIRLNSDGSVDDTFNSGTGFNNQIKTIALQSDNKILIGGDFTSYSGVTANHIIRLNSDGSVDDTFNSGTGFDSYPWSIVVQFDGNILVGGNFFIYNSQLVYGLIRLNPNGSIDSGFSISNNIDNDVNSIALQSDNKILIGGDFTSYSGVTANHIIRLNSDGSVDDTFNSGTGFNNQAFKVVTQSDDKILVGGLFTNYNGNNRNRIIRLNSDGSIDTNFISGNGISGLIVSSIVVQPSDNKILIGGNFNSYNDVSENYIVRVSNDNLSTTITFKTQGDLRYGLDFSSNFTSRSIPDVAWVLSQLTGGTGSTSVTANNGLTKSGDNIYLGGSLTGDTTLLTNKNLRFYGDNTNNKYFSVDLNGDGLRSFFITSSDTSGDFDNAKLGYLLNTGGGIGEEYSFHIKQNFGVSMQYVVTGSTNNYHKINVLGSGIFIDSDLSTFKGLKYTNDFSANFDARSIPDVGFVTGLTSSGSVLAGNGLTKIGNVIKLGGAVTEATTIFSDNVNTFSINTQKTDDGIFIQQDFKGDSSLFYAQDSSYAAQQLVNPQGFFTSARQFFYNNKEYINQVTYSSSRLGFRDSGNSTLTMLNFNEHLPSFSSSFSGFTGVQYENDYSANFNDRTLPDIGWVKAHVSGATSGSTGKLDTIVLVSSNVTLAITTDLALVATTGGTYTVTLPASPSDGYKVTIKDDSGNADANNITIGGNGKNIDGAASFLIATDYGAATIAYSSTRNKWYVTAFVN